MNGWMAGDVATVADLFAGTGGMGLASLLTSELRDHAQIIFTAEIEPSYVSMIRRNYSYFARHIGDADQVPTSLESRDLCRTSSLDDLRQTSRRHGGLTLLLAGPPCQGFSAANSMSRDHKNPLNKLSLRAVDAIAAGRPQIAIIENVPGIQTMESARHKSLSVSDVIEKRLRDIGYIVRSALLDAADYGVAQHRVRSFTVAIKKRIAHEFDLDCLFPRPKYGPGRRFPYRTVRDALGDLPRLSNGTCNFVCDYRFEAANPLQKELRRYSPAVYDHVTTKHADYVIERYKAISPGGNWRQIRNRLRNFTDPDNTHTNIYHRLHSQYPSRTIGNFRKAMTVHPWENRGLSVREAARLQSLPDWLRFFEDDAPLYRNGTPRGLGAKQQQVGNAVCFKLTSQLVSHLMANA